MRNKHVVFCVLFALVACLAIYHCGRDAIYPLLVGLVEALNRLR